MKKISLITVAAMLALSPALAAQQIAEPTTIEEETYFGVREIPGFGVTGKYLYESKGEPSVTLNADGSGSFALHGRPAQGKADHTASSTSIGCPAEAC